MVVCIPLPLQLMFFSLICHLSLFKKDSKVLSVEPTEITAMKEGRMKKEIQRTQMNQGFK